MNSPTNRWLTSLMEIQSADNVQVFPVTQSLIRVHTQPR